MKFDLIIIGSGPGGYRAAITAAFLDAKVALIEKHQPGGNCLNLGCVPTKALVHLAELLEDVQSMQGRGLVGNVQADFNAAYHYKNDVVEGIRKNFPVWLKRLGVHVFQGHATLQANKQVCVTSTDNLTSNNKSIEQIIHADKIIIATGSKPNQHPAFKTNGDSILNSDDFMQNMDQKPTSVLCVGGGAIGTELGFVMRQFGSEVTIVEHAARLLDKPDISERASAALERKLTSLGINIIKQQSVRKIEKQDGQLKVTFTNDKQHIFDKVLLAIGRQPVTHNLGLENTDICFDQDGFIKTNAFLETNHPGIYAIGDVKPGPMTANAALHDAKIAATNAILGNKLHTNYHQVPTVIQSALQIATVGLNEDQAEDAGFEADVARSNFVASVKGRAKNDTQGYTEITHDEETGQLLGGCIVGAEAGEQVQMLTAAIQSDRGLWFFNDINYSHPSWCEELENAINPFTSEITKSGADIFRPGIYANKK